MKNIIAAFVFLLLLFGCDLSGELSYEKLEEISEVEYEKLNFSCESDDDCAVLGVGWCGQCGNKNNNTEQVKKLGSVYDLIADRNCFPDMQIVECALIVDCMCENNKCLEVFK